MMKHILLCTFLLCLWSGEAGVAQDKTKDKNKPHPLWVTEKPISTTVLPRRPTSMCYSPDGKHLALSFDLRASGGLVMLANGEGKRLKRVIGEDAGILCVAFLPDQKTLATTSTNGEVTFYDRKAGRFLRRINARPRVVTDRLTHLAATYLAFSPDSKLFALGWGQGGHVWVYDTNTGKLVRKMQGRYPSYVGPLVFSPDNKWLAAGDGSGIIKIWSLKTGRLSSTLDPLPPSKSDLVNWWDNPLCFSKDGWMLATRADGGQVRVWERASGKTRQIIENDPDSQNRILDRFGIFSSTERFLAISPDKQLMARVEITQPNKRKPTAITYTLLVSKRRERPRKKTQPQPRLPKSDIKKLTPKLRAASGFVAYPAIRKLVRCEGVVEELAPTAQRIQKQYHERVRAIAKLVKQLGSERFQTRAKAAHQLKLAAWLDFAGVKQHLNKPLALEAKLRLQRIVEEFPKQSMPEDLLFYYRSIEIIERCATKQSMGALKRLSQAEASILTQEAQYAHYRLGKTEPPD